MSDSKLLTFNPKEEGVHVDLDRLVAGRMLLQATSGGGKSWMLRYILEQTYGKIQQFVIDPEGEFSTLREKFDYLLVGKVEKDGDGVRLPGSADIQADPRTAKVLARRLVEIGAYAVLDLSELKIDKRREFVLQFLDGLMTLPKALWHSLLVVIDEADIFAPEGKSAGDASSLAAMVDLASRGRKRGYALLAATQRLAKLNKDVAGMLTNKLIGRTTLDIDLSRAANDLGLFKPDWLTLKSLEDGCFFATGPAFDEQVVIVHSGAIQTTHPRPGVVVPPSAAPSAKVSKLLAGLNDIPETAEKEIRDLDGARREISRLDLELRRVKRAPDQESIEAATKPLRERLAEVEAELRARPEETDLAKARREGIQAIATQVEVRLASFRADLDGWLAEEGETPLARPTVAAKGAVPRIPMPAPLAAPAPVQPRGPSAAAEQPPRETREGEIRLSTPQRKILDALASFEVAGYESLSRIAAGVFSGASPDSSGFGNNLSALRTAGLIDYPKSGFINLTAEGRERAVLTIATSFLEAFPTPWIDAMSAAQAKVLLKMLAANPDSAPTLGAFHDAWCSNVSGPQERILRVLIKAYPGALARDDVAEAAGVSPSSSGYGNNLSFLRSTLGLIDYPSGGYLVATPLLFPEGLQ